MNSSRNLWLSCMGSNISCDSRLIDSIVIDPDVAGYGVLVAFLLNGVITLAAMYFGYFADYIEDSSKNHLDEIVLGWVSNWRLISKLSKEERARKLRIKKLQQFMLALSDQQLVTGFALLVAAFSLSCSISVLNFQIASSLAWFSTMTHLATISILGQYFRDRRMMLNVRVVGMLAVVFLLSASIFTANEFYDIILPLQCSYANIASIKNTSDASAFGFRNDILPGGWAAAWVIVYLMISSGSKILPLLSSVVVRGRFSQEVMKTSEPRPTSNNVLPLPVRQSTAADRLISIPPAVMGNPASLMSLSSSSLPLLPLSSLAIERLTDTDQSCDEYTGQVILSATQEIRERCGQRVASSRIACLIFAFCITLAYFAVILAGFVKFPFPNVLPLVFTLIWGFWYMWNNGFLAKFCSVSFEAFKLIMRSS